MFKSISFLVVTGSVALLLGACGAVEDQDAERGTFVMPQNVGKADLPWYSCARNCNKQAPGGCWCDAQCVVFGDCCADYQQVCKKSNKCSSNQDCAAGKYCKFGDGMCLLPTLMPLQGTCKVQPTVCNRMFAPVCGCDNKTYGNSCNAAAAGVSIAYKGQCNPPTPPKCDTLDKAQCQKRTDCEWITMNGFPGPISMCQEKSKPKKCGPFLGGQCAAGEVCNIKSCALGATGLCEKQPQPQDCVFPMYLPVQPVCGCDGKTYGSDCDRLAAGVPRAHTGACKVPGPKKCAANADCKVGEYCHFNDGMCLLPTFNILQGKCTAMPTVCYEIYGPVCGCDGKEYDNDCFAHAVGTSVAYNGKCNNP